MPEIVVKRDGREEPFLSFKIDDAIKKAYTSVGQLHNPNILNKVLEKLHGDKINIEDIQDTIEEVLYDMGTYKVLKSFIQYRQIHKLQRDISNSDKENATFIDCNETIDEYIGKTDWRIHANSNTSYSHGGLINNTAGKVIANYWLDKVLTKKQGLLHREGFIHVHDLDCLSPYCFIGSTKIKLYDGTSKTFLELTKEWDKKNKPFEVVSVNRYGLFEKGTARAPRLIKKDADLVEVMLSNGKSEICTPDHEFMLLNNTYKQAQYLQPNDVLKTCYKFVDDELDLVDIYVKDVKTLDYKEDVYCLTVDRYHNFMLDSSVIVKNCAGWSLRALLDEGFNGSRGKIDSRAPKHAMEAFLQAANFLSCFTGDTEVILANGKKMRMEDMAKYKDKVWMVKGYDSQTDQVLPTELYNVHETRKVTELIELEFEDGDKVTCTLDHKFYTINRGWVEAKDLTEEDVLPKYEQNKYIVYKVTNTKTGEFYIGQHITTNVNDDYLGSGTSLLKNIEKYGRDVFEKEILDYAPNRIALANMEKFYIEKEIDNPKCLNITRAKNYGYGFVNKLLKQTLDGDVYMDVNKEIESDLETLNIGTLMYYKNRAFYCDYERAKKLHKKGAIHVNVDDVKNDGFNDYIPENYHTAKYPLKKGLLSTSSYSNIGNKMPEHVKDILNNIFNDKRKKDEIYKKASKSLRRKLPNGLSVASNALLRVCRNGWNKAKNIIEGQRKRGTMSFITNNPNNIILPNGNSLPRETNLRRIREGRHNLVIANQMGCHNRVMDKRKKQLEIFFNKNKEYDINNVNEETYNEFIKQFPDWTGKFNYNGFLYTIERLKKDILFKSTERGQNAN